MSPTSYQTAPPRISIIQTCEHPVKRLNLAAAVSELGHHWHSRTPVGMQARAVSQGPMLTGLLVGEDVPERESDGGVRDVVVCFGGGGSAGSRRRAGVGREGTGNRNPEKTTQLLGGAHRMRAAMQATNTIEPLNG